MSLYTSLLRSKNPQRNERMLQLGKITQSEYEELMMLSEEHSAEPTIEDFFENQPTRLDTLEAQILYTAVMTDTLIEE